MPTPPFNPNDPDDRGLVAGHLESAPTDVVARLQPPEQYREQRAHVFQSSESFRWFVRRHRGALVTAGAIRQPTGRWLVDPVAFDRVLLDDKR
jgi:hypothetical protein